MNVDLRFKFNDSNLKDFKEETGEIWSRLFTVKGTGVGEAHQFDSPNISKHKMLSPFSRG